MSAPRPPQEIQVDPEVGIPDLIRRLTDDSKRLVTDEVQLAKLETKESVRAAAHGALWMAIAFGVGIIALAAATIFLAALIGHLASGHMWLGALVTGVIELALAAWMIRRGIGAFGTPAYTLPESRAEIESTARWAKHPRAD